jgi:uncharacterized protein YndB with AHSA1/START domain
MYASSASIVVQAPRSKVWDALTKPELVKKYFFGTNLETDWKPGSPLLFHGEWEGKTYEDRGTVLEFKPEDTLTYNYWSSFSDTPDTPERRQIIRFDLADVPEGVRLSVRQSNVDTQERADHSKENWKMVLEGLKKLVES